MDSAIDRYFDEALELLEERRFTQAVDAFSELVALDPGYEGAYGNRGLAYLSLGMYDAAREDFEAVLRFNPDDAMAHAMLGELMRAAGDDYGALARAVAAMELEPSEGQPYYTRGWLFAKAGQYEQAAADLRRYLELAGETDDVADLAAACETLAAPGAEDDAGRPLDAREAADRYLSAKGLSFDMAANPDFAELALPCAYAHCIRNCQPLCPEAPGACPAFGYACPGDVEQTAWCREHPPAL